ncbi:MAG TPA: 50S ribosomal protein L13 [Pseudobdellovibrionaceae bacterium]|nr:50S ribosomal protein L13 [Pseudobdellovibrionaceae bacterium]
MKTYVQNKDEVQRKWHIIDASGQRVGRLATQVATLLRGKNKAIFTPHVDCGDFVVVINTDKLELTGVKWETKKFYRHSRFFGSMKEKTAAEMKIEDSTFILSEAVRGMLPTNKLSRHVLEKLKAYPGAEHPHASQKPEAYTLS